ncbi:hypothetical protein NESM_000166400 [Novymonas esmeraldas]|uniref:Uncharacterized protein n=1 Tax=Novymonas esmeraldas TaxID=1808958 RepID=A0AAW0F5X5_9TRYP
MIQWTPFSCSVDTGSSTATTFDSASPPTNTSSNMPVSAESFSTVTFKVDGYPTKTPPKVSSVVFEKSGGTMQVALSGIASSTSRTSATSTSNTVS